MTLAPVANPLFVRFCIVWAPYIFFATNNFSPISLTSAGSSLSEVINFRVTDSISRIAWIEQYVTYTGAWRGVRERPYCSLCDVYPRTFAQRALTSIRNRHTNDTMLFSLSHAVGFIFVGSTVRILTHAGQPNARNLQQSHQARV